MACINTAFPIFIFLSSLFFVNISSNVSLKPSKSTSINRTLSSTRKTIPAESIEVNFTMMNEVTLREEPIVKHNGESTKSGRINSCENSIDCKDTQMRCVNTSCIRRCNNSAECEDPRTTCREGICSCSREYLSMSELEQFLFHYRDARSKECTPNITRILSWLRQSASTESDAESQGSAFKVTRVEPYTILTPIWAEYKGSREIGLGYIPKPVWTIFICIGLFLLIYGLILYDIL